MTRDSIAVSNNYIPISGAEFQNLRRSAAVSTHAIVADVYYLPEIEGFVEAPARSYGLLCLGLHGATL